MASLLNEHTQFLDADGKPYVAGSIYIGTRNEDPVANPISIYSDRALTIALANPQLTDADGRSVNKIWLEGRYSIQVNDSDDVQVYQQLDSGAEGSTGISPLINVQGTDNITADSSPAITALVDLQQYVFTSAGANTGAVTLQVDLIAAKSVLKYHDVELTVDDIEDHQIVAVIYNETDDTFELISNSNPAGDLVAATDGPVNTPQAGFGEFWVRQPHIGPTEPMFTDDSGNNFNLLGVSGTIKEWETEIVPVGWLEMDDTLRNMTTYENLFDVVSDRYGLDAGTTFTAAADDIITAAAHGFSDGDVLTMANSGGALPAGLVADTKYYVLFLTTGTFNVALTRGGAIVDITDAGTGTQTLFRSFLNLDMRGKFPRGWNHGAGVDPDTGSRTDRGDGTTGDNVGTPQADEFELHLHSTSGGGTPAVTGASGADKAVLDQPGNTGSSGGNETRPVNVYVMFIIKI